MMTVIIIIIIIAAVVVVVVVAANDNGIRIKCMSLVVEVGKMGRINN